MMHRAGSGGTHGGGRADPPSSSTSLPPRRLGVLGIGLITEASGKGARVAFRYPASPPPYFADACTDGHSRGDAHGASRGGAGRGGRSPRNGAARGTKGSQTGGTSAADGAADNDDGTSGGGGGSIDLFFDLPARVLSKLFRPKRPLCGQPLTLNVSGTTFCCRAELFDAQSQQHQPQGQTGAPSTVGGEGGSSGSSNANANANPLVLFSVIVALAPLASSAADGGEVDANPPPHSSAQHSFDAFGNEKQHQAGTTDASNNNHTHNNHHHPAQHGHAQHGHAQRTDEAFATIRRVHGNLARLCRVLMREEVRCRYVSRQCGMLHRVQKEYESTAGPDVAGGTSLKSSGDGGGVGGGSGSGTKAAAVAESIGVGKKAEGGNAPPGPPPLSPKVKTPAPPAASKTKDGKSSKTTNTASSSNESGKDRPVMTRDQRREYVQNLIEIMLAASPPTSNATANSEDDDYALEKELYGNLARELAQAFHCMSSSSSSGANGGASSAGTTGREGVVYVNRHIAVPLDPIIEGSAVRRDISHTTPSHLIQPHHALLFPTSSPADVLRGLADKGVGETTTNAPSISQFLQRLLPHVQPRKSLNDLAWDTGLPLPQILDAVGWLVRSGTCVAAAPVVRKNRYVCVARVVSKMATLALPFWQAFGARSRNCKFFWGNGAASGAANADDDSVDRRRAATVGAPHIFVVVSALTTTRREGDGAAAGSAPPTLGEAIDSLCGIDEPRNDEEPSPRFRYGEHRRPASANNLSLELTLSSAGASIGALDTSAAEEVVYSMACWLVANGILVEATDRSTAAAITPPPRGGRNGSAPSSKDLP